MKRGAWTATLSGLVVSLPLAATPALAQGTGGGGGGGSGGQGGAGQGGSQGAPQGSRGPDGRQSSGQTGEEGGERARGTVQPGPGERQGGPEGARDRRRDSTVDPDREGDPDRGGDPRLERERMRWRWDDDHWGRADDWWDGGLRRSRYPYGRHGDRYYPYGRWDGRYDSRWDYPYDRRVPSGQRRYDDGWRDPHGPPGYDDGEPRYDSPRRGDHFPGVDLDLREGQRRRAQRDDDDRGGLEERDGAGDRGGFDGGRWYDERYDWSVRGDGWDAWYDAWPEGDRGPDGDGEREGR